MLFGYAGRIGCVDLTQRTVKIQDLEESVVRHFLGGKGLGAFLLDTRMEPRLNSFDPRVPLIFVTGPLTGTTFPATSRSGVVTRSPLTGTFLDSYAGGFFGPHLKRAGYDALVITGRASEPTVLLIDDVGISFRSASHLWGLTTSQTEARIREELKAGKARRVSVAAIGPAGEKLVRFAAILNDRRAYGRGGAGAVMGAKNLKAAAIRGEGSFPIRDAASFRDVVKRCEGKIANHPLTRPGGPWPCMGTLTTIDVTNATGTLPARNWQQNSFEPASSLSGAAFDKYLVGHRACFACPIGCTRESRASKHGVPFVTEGPDYETVYAFGPNCGVTSPELIIAADSLCDEYGLDTISCGVTIGFAME